MEATQVFQSIMESIESSNLNYSLSKTPFSASISLKCSFIKRYEEFPPVPVTNMNFTKSLSTREQDDNAKQLEVENVELRAELDSLIHLHESDKKIQLKEIVNLKDSYNNEKEVSKALEKNIAEFREDILKIKREKHDLSNNLKIKEEECENLKAKVKVSDAEYIDMKKRVKDKGELADKIKAELLSTKHELKEVEDDLVMIKCELDNVKLDRAKKPTDFNCEFCHINFKTYIELKHHIRKTHCQNKATQFDEKKIFLQYKCFYCDNTFSSRNDLEEHPSDCHNHLVQPSSFRDNICEMCTRTFCDVKELEMHIKVDHLESEVFCCDICPLYFASDCELQFHIRGCHWNQM